MIRRVVLVAAFAVGGCGGGVASGSLQVPVQKSQEPNMPAPPREDLVEKIHGVTVADPFRPLEVMENASAWIDAQNRATDRWMAAHARSDAADRLSDLLRIGTVGGPVLAGTQIFYVGKAGTQEQPVLYVRAEGKSARVLVDPNQVDPSGHTSLDWYHPSKDGRLLAFGLSKDGDENSTLGVIEVATGRLLSDQIPLTRACSVAWELDGTGFFYTRFQGAEAYNRHVYHHTLGQDVAKDRLILGPERLTERTDWPTVTLSDDGRHLVVVRFQSWSKSSIHVLERASGAWTDIELATDGLFSSVDMVGGRLWAVSTHGAPRGQVVVIDPARPAREAWRIVVAQEEATLSDAMLLEGGVATLHLRHAAAWVRLWPRDDKTTSAASGGSGSPKPVEVPLPVAGTITGWHGRADDPRLVMAFESFFYAPALLLATSASPRPQVLEQVDASFDASAYRVNTVEYISYDGTPVSMFVIHREGVKLDGRNPTLLYGYGGFNVSLTPSFGRSTLFWLENGGVFAVANLRGGGEHGEAWHQAGTLGRKFQVFEDFEYAARYLVRTGYTRPSRLAIMGGSNGGLLVGALITRAPHLFAAAVSKVGLYDMVRYHRFPPAELWTEEYGVADEPEHVGYLWAYSPYHQVLPGVRYPAVLASTTDTDTRVHWSHTAKFVAALQEAQAGQDPVLMRFERATGHGAGKSTTDIVKEYVETYQFLLQAIGAPSSRPGDRSPEN